MSNDKERAVHERVVHYIGKFSRVLDKAEDGLMKTHELVGHLYSDVGGQLVSRTQLKLMDMAEALAQYRQEVWTRVEEDEAKVYAEPTARHAKRGGDSESPQGMTRDEKIKFIIEGFGLPDMQWQKDKLAATSDAVLDGAINQIKKFRNR